MSSPIQKFVAIERRVNQFVLGMACLLMAIVCLLGLWQVVTRFLLSQPSTWTEEAMRRLLIWSVMFGVVAAFRHGALINVDLMLRLSSGWWLRVVQTFIAVVSITFLAIIVWYGIDLVWRVRFQTFASMNDISMSWGYAALPIGAAFSILAILGRALDPTPDEQADSAV